MNIARVRSLRLPFIALAFIVGLGALGAGLASATEVITLRSGNAAPGSADPYITMLAGSGGAPLSASPFTPGDFDQACDGPSAIVLYPVSVYLQHLACDSLAQWIGIDAFATPASALFCQTFDVETLCIERASLSFCWVTDDVLGDPLAGGPNPDGVYLNGVAVSPSIFGGNYATETVASLTDVTSLLVTGTNRLEVYVRDIGYSVSGVMYSATLEITDCTTPTESTTWGAVKSLFHQKPME